MLIISETFLNPLKFDLKSVTILKRAVNINSCKNILINLIFYANSYLDLYLNK